MSIHNMIALSKYDLLYNRSDFILRRQSIY